MTKPLLDKLLNPTEGVRIMMALQPENDWLKVKKRLPGRQVFLNPILKIAASLVLAVLIGIVAYRFLMPERFVAYKIIQNTTEDVQAIAMEDGSTIYLNTGASIRYPEDFKTDRRIELSGESFFEVKRDEANAFVIKAQQCEVEVLGTSFSVNADSARVEVIVKTGKVSFQSTPDNGVVLVKNERALYSTGSTEILKENDNDPNSFAWQTHILTFENAPIDRVIGDLEKYFRVTIRLEGNSTNVPNYTSRFDNPSLKDVLEEMKLILPIEYTIKGSEAIVKIIPQ
jgi:ferric-dicitrate binding protein FerR (iron transport regulator)